MGDLVTGIAKESLPSSLESPSRGQDAVVGVASAGTSPLAAVFGIATCSLATVVLILYEVSHLTGYSFGQSWYSVDDYDEGVYIETGALMAHGYHLYSQIYSAQPPVLTSVLALMDRATGSGVAQSRVVVLIFGLILVGATSLLACRLGGWVAAGLSALLLVFSPEMLVYAHAVEEEVPAMALGTLALSMGILWYQKRSVLWAILGGVLFGLAVLTKFFAFALLPPLLAVMVLALLDRDNAARSTAAILRACAGFMLAALVVIGTSLLVWGGDEWQQMVGDRISASTGQVASLQGVSNLHLLRLFVMTDPGLALMALLGGIAVLVLDWRSGVILDTWAVATLAMLMKYHPLFGHHLVIVLAPAATVATVSIALTFAALQDRRVSSIRKRLQWDRHSPANYALPIFRLAVALGVVALLAYVAFLPRLVTAYPRLLIPQNEYGQVCNASNASAGNIEDCRTMTVDRTNRNVARVIARRVSTHGRIAAGDPWICVDASRLCVPGLVDTSYVRVETGKLTAQEAIRLTASYKARSVVLERGLCTVMAGGKTYMRRYAGWVTDHYRLLQSMVLAGSSRTCKTGVYGQ